MKIDKKAVTIVMARKCLSFAELSKIAMVPRPTLNGALSGKNVRPETVGKIAKALNVDVTEIIENEKY